MMPAVPVPRGAGVRTPVDFKLKPQWRFDASRRAFVSESGETFALRGALPKNSKIVYKVPSLARAAPAALSAAERDLQHYMQLILPPDSAADDYLQVVRAWPCVAEAHLAPAVSLPGL